MKINKNPREYLSKIFPTTSIQGKENASRNRLLQKKIYREGDKNDEEIGRIIRVVHFFHRFP